MNKLRIIGLMSGTSLDGLDLAACTFSFDSGWSYEINHSKTVEYSEEVKSALQNLDKSTALQYAKMDHQLGRLMAKETKKFVEETGFATQYISSHGHTVFHQPEINLTTQIGHPSAIAALTKTPVIADFRTTDVHIGGQGAPLVPIGDKLLFQEYKYCLNLGGIANISIKDAKNPILAYDICIANMALNMIAKKENLEYDKNGELARLGKVNSELLNELNQLQYLNQVPPKSIGKEWFDAEINPILSYYAGKFPNPDLLATLCEHIAFQIGEEIHENGKLLITGGGAKNSFLVERIKAHSKAAVIVPDQQLINFKEALIFAFLGALRVKKEVNIFQSVTGSDHDHVGGCVYMPFPELKNK